VNRCAEWRWAERHYAEYEIDPHTFQYGDVALSYYQHVTGDVPV